MEVASKTAITTMEGTSVTATLALLALVLENRENFAEVRITKNCIERATCKHFYKKQRLTIPNFSSGITKQQPKRYQTSSLCKVPQVNFHSIFI